MMSAQAPMRLRRFLLASFLGVALACVLLCFGSIWLRMTSVRTSWHGDTLLVSSLRQYVTITDLRYATHGTEVTATLPKPYVAYGDIARRFSLEELRKLDWRGSNSTHYPPPIPGEKVQVRYHIAHVSDFGN